MTKGELVLSLQGTIVNHEDCNKFLDAYMSKNYPDLKPETFETDEASETKYYGLRGEVQMSLWNAALGNLHALDDDLCFD